MAHNPPRSRTAPRTSRAYSIASDSTYTPHATPPPPARRGAANGTRGIRAATVDTTEDTDIPTRDTQTRIPAHYSLPPTVPSSFHGDIGHTLDLILKFGLTLPTLRTHGLQAVLDTLSAPVKTCTNWPPLLRAVWAGSENSQTSRALIEEILFFATRVLMPEGIAENRNFMARLYERKKQLAIRLGLRYDMLREWEMDGSNHPLTVASLAPPVDGSIQVPAAPRVTSERARAFGRRALMPNVVATLIAAPPGGWTTHAVRERMKHHITALDSYLVLTDEQVAAWNDETVLGMCAQVVLQWQWLRENNRMLEEMETMGWEELEGSKEECEWILEEGRSKGGTGGGKVKVKDLEDGK
ncbi:hypothetical protein EK21DRAFT_103701 [Setomelanomma holmii]|uniref:Uncharacterized protein n=1 Tax=Setomelanomma holmii TaxID=210430 RepID=A0A9P4H280_9PLEO|nr:hypothetical protein EK21DRAFT_103701 [Setomelanomma holmii]